MKPKSLPKSHTDDTAQMGIISVHIDLRTYSNVTAQIYRNKGIEDTCLSTPPSKGCWS